jgi:hypothetical protein
MPVRCDHSEVTSRTPATGSRTAAGNRATSKHRGEGVLGGVADRERDDHEQRREHDGRHLHPEAGAGVDDLAQLDGDEPAEAGTRVDAGGVQADG